MAFAEYNTAFETATGYGVTPWGNLEGMSYDWYVPTLMAAYHEHSNFRNLVRFAVDMRAQRTKKIIWTQPMELEADIEERELRGLWLPDSYTDTRQLEITTSNYGGKVQVHKHDDYIWQWSQSGKKNADLAGFVKERLGRQMVNTLDQLARNAIVAGGVNRMFSGSKTSFGTLTTSDTFDPTVARALRLGGYSQRTVTGTIPAMVTQSAVYSVKNSASTTNYVDWTKYANPGQLLKNAIGDFEDVTFMENRDLTLWCAGTVLATHSITAAVNEGDGAPDPETTKVDEVWMVGQADATHYIQLDDTFDGSNDSEADIKAGDVIVIHRVYQDGDTEMGVDGGIQYDHHANYVREVFSVDYDNHRITLKKPVLADKFKTEIDSTGFYGYVTKARHIHPSVFFLGADGLVAGVTQAPEMHILDPIDDREAIRRFTWDAYLKYQTFNPYALQLYFHTGHILRNGSVVTY